ncbi:MAG: NAD(P)H-binding protein [Gemmatimonadota bacterium]|nr:NAD(P)H-binding protein [Gemmatimonadota bacterium]MDH3479953.1 NAD(P)H-binding protein [Gemmatimonadota bacterium]MDH5551101.1 NAD(P)H-binding protein [Gemmatimonadota bacterium]
MADPSPGEVHVVTGAFGYSGRYIAQRLLNAGRRVATLTNSAHRPDPFGGRVPAYPLQFHDPQALTESLRGVAVLYNTYWVRFNHKTFNHREAVANTLTLFQAAKAAGVRRVVHVSITNPSAESELPYFSGKAELEAALKSSGLSYAILRPTVLFGKEDILINNIAWILRHFPAFGVFGDGQYRLQPIYVDDLAELAVTHGGRPANVTIEAIGPETFTYRKLVKTIGRIIGCPRPVLSVPPGLGYWVGRALGALKGDVVITREEIQGLMEGRLYVDAAPAGATALTRWVAEHRATLGVHYASELARRR